MPLDWQNMHRYLQSNSSNKLASVANIAAAFYEEEASCKLSLLKVVARDRVCNRRLSCAGHAAQLEEALRMFAIGPS